MDQNSEDIFDIDSSILPGLGKTMKALDFYIADEFTHRGMSLTKAQLILLRRLTMNDGIPQQSLAFITNRDKTSLTRLIHTMEKKGYVIRKSDENDKRIKQVYITPIGKNALKEAFPVMKEINDKIEAGIPKEKILATIALLKQVRNNINADF